MKQAWPDAEYLSFNRWDVSRRNLALWAFAPIPDSPQDGTADRWLYFDGENLLVYRDGRATADHLMEGAEAPEDVMAVLRDYVQEQYTGDHEGLLFVEGGDFVPAPLEYDDWRIESIEGPSYVSVGGLDFAIWSMNYELHTTTPESVILAGGTYMTEDCWVSPGYPGCDYFYFQLDEGGNRTYLYHRMENDCVPGTELFFSDMAYQLREMGLLSFYDLTERELLDISCSQPVHFFNTLSETNLSEQSQALAAMAACVAAGDDPGTQEIYDSIAHYMEIFSDDLTDGGRAAWQALQSALSSWTAAGDGTVYESGGLSLWVPEGWADMAVVTAEDAVWFGESVPGFDVYERLAHISNPDTGLVWNVRALTRAQFQAAFGDADWSEILGASSYVIGSDDAYIYLLSTPTDVQFLVEDPTSMAQYELLRNQSQTVIEGFFFRNGITPNPDCPDADGCYVGPKLRGGQGCCSGGDGRDFGPRCLLPDPLPRPWWVRRQKLYTAAGYGGGHLPDAGEFPLVPRGGGLAPGGPGLPDPHRRGRQRRPPVLGGQLPGPLHPERRDTVVLRTADGRDGLCRLAPDL